MNQLDDTKFIANEIYDFLFENNEVKLDFNLNFESSYIDCDTSTIYLESDEMGCYKITVERTE